MNIFQISQENYNKRDPLASQRTSPRLHMVNLDSNALGLYGTNMLPPQQTFELPAINEGSH